LSPQRNVERMRHDKEKWSRKKMSGEGERLGSKGTTSVASNTQTR